MTRDNRLSAQLEAGAIDTILQALTAVRAQLPFLVTLTPQERK